MLIAMDPGIRGCGLAVFDGAKLRRAAYVKNPQHAGNDAAACLSMARAVYDWLASLLAPSLSSARHALVLEWPRALKASRQKGSKRGADHDDLLALVGVDCAVAAALQEALQACMLPPVSVFPDVWKDGSVDKEVMNRRVWERLSAEEQARVERTPRGGGLLIEGVEGGLRHDVLDAVGIGLHHLGRLKRRRVYASGVVAP